jgi:spore protease
MGVYDTLSTDRLDTLCEEELYDVREELGRRLCELLDENGIFPGRILVVGFGNRNLTPDSVGPKSAEMIKPTLHISEYEPDIFDELDCSEIAVFCPTVPAVSGMDSASNVRSLCERLMPDVVFAIDSIMTESPERLGSTFQLSTTGLYPGGVGNLHSPITKASMGAPVIGIGVPTVMDCRSVCESFKDKMHFFISPREIDEITNNAAFVIGGAINQFFGLDL